MKDDTKTERVIPKHYTSTAELLDKFEKCDNPVTKSVYRTLIENRIGTTERQDQVRKSRNYSMRKYLDKCTFSFDGRKRMENSFSLWFMN